MIQPFTSKDFGIRSLADRIFDLQQLMYLYPDICKDHAFGKYYTPYTGMLFHNVFKISFTIKSESKS